MMFKTILALTAIGLATADWQQRDVRPTLRLKEEKMTLRYTVSEEQAVIVVEAESEAALGQIEVCDPLGKAILRMGAVNGHSLTLSGFKLETAEYRDEEILGAYPEGVYEIRARTTDGQLALGSAVLTHGLPHAPTIQYPLSGFEGVPTNMTVFWEPVPEAVAYTVALEQGDNDGLTVELPAGSSFFDVPAGILASRTETFLEVGAVGENGNCTSVETVFTTM